MKRKFLIGLPCILIIGFIIPQDLKMPVVNAGSSDYNHDSFWYYPWGKSVTHKGVDIFAKKGTTINSATIGLVLYSGKVNIGGNVVAVLGPKWRVHYYAHLDELEVSTLSLLSSTSELGTVGDSGNAKGKQPHLHYSIVSMVPLFWLADDSIQGWKKMFYLDPIGYLKN